MKKDAAPGEGQRPKRATWGDFPRGSGKRGAAPQYCKYRLIGIGHSDLPDGSYVGAPVWVGEMHEGRPLADGSALDAGRRI
jgi:hypothetical protein